MLSRLPTGPLPSSSEVVSIESRHLCVRKPQVLKRQHQRIRWLHRVSKRVKTFICWLSGRLSPFSHERTTDAAIPILAAKWPGVRFFSVRLARIQSPTVFMLSSIGLALFCFLAFWPNCMEIWRCAIPSRATLPRERGQQKGVFFHKTGGRRMLSDVLRSEQNERNNEFGTERKNRPEK